jgi:uncharacterized protein YjdB
MRWPARFVVVAVVLAAVGACRSSSEGEKGRLERITVGPHEARRSVGDAQRFTATGHYAGGATRNLTQRVDWTSSDPAVASAANTKGDRSRIEAVAPGKVTISVKDPKTGIGSHAENGDATLVVLGKLERIVLTPSVVTRVAGQTQRLTATGHFAGGTTRNLTQHLDYRSSDPDVAAAPNADGDKSRIEIVGPGTATITAVDQATGVSSATGNGDATVTVTLPKP